MPKALKRMMAAELESEIEEVSDVFVVGLLPMDAENNVELRSTLRSMGARLRVIHNRTAQHALDETKRPLADFFDGQTALALCKDEAIPVAKTLVKAAKEKKLEVRGGYVDGDVMDASGVQDLASAPDKPTLQGMLLGTVLGPARGIAVALNSVGGGIARCLQARIDQAGGEEEATENQETA